MKVNDKKGVENSKVPIDGGYTNSPHGISNKNILIDYLSVSFPGSDYNEDILKNEIFLGLTNILNIDIKQHDEKNRVANYEKMLIYGEHIYFKVNGPFNKYGQRVHGLELKGQGCREIERLGVSWYDLLMFIYFRQDMKVTRIDLALDLFTDKYFKLDDLYLKFIKGEYDSCLDYYSGITSGYHKKGTSAGLTFGLGRDKQERDKVTVYNKKTERYQKGYYPMTNVWYRFEITLRERKAPSLLHELFKRGYEDLPNIYYELLNKYLVFLNEDKSTVWKPWRMFNETIKTLELKNQAKLESTITSKINWHHNSVAPSEFEIALSVNSIGEWLALKYELIASRLDKLDNQTLTRINKYRVDKGLGPFSSIGALKAHAKNIVNEKEKELVNEK
ncbi:replication initiation factor domain-containing protein [Mycoplasmatota bacterium WC44]